MSPGTRNRSSAHTRRELQKEIQKRQNNAKERPKDVRESGGEVIAMVDGWCPSQYTALKALLSARLCAAIWGLINDCDETYNYWEPTHYLLYGKGFQTWEYSPVFALRSYTYLLLHAVPGWLYSTLLQPNPMLVFFFIRCCLALGCSGAELYFYRGVCKEFGNNIGLITLGVQVFAAGMFNAATAFLPSSFAMYMTLLSMGAWYHQAPQLAIFTTAISTFLGWPFAGALGVPIAYDIIIRRKQIAMFVKWCIISTLTILVPMVQIDSQYFGRLVIAPVNIVLYNVFSSHGPNLYGVEPWTFYFINGFLNFNIMFVAAIVSIPLYTLAMHLVSPPRRSGQSLPVWLSVSPMYLWLAVFILQPHKEERFLFPIYPLFCLAGAVATGYVSSVERVRFITDSVQRLWWWLRGGRSNHYLQHTTWLTLSILAVSTTLGVSRIFAQYRAYHAPIETFMEVNRLSAEGHFPKDRPITLCLGKEWHRFPSSFFLPGLNWDVEFIKSDFVGQLPGHYSDEVNATALIPTHVNDLNQEEPSRYVNIESCELLVDLDREDETTHEPRYSSQKDWTVIHSLPFMDTARSNRLLRAFYVPFLTERYSTYLNYTLLHTTRSKRNTRKIGR